MLTATFLGKRGFYRNSVEKKWDSLTLFCSGAKKGCQVLRGNVFNWHRMGVLHHCTVLAIMRTWQQWSKQITARLLQLKQVILGVKAGLWGRFMGRKWHSLLKTGTQIPAWSIASFPVNPFSSQLQLLF